MGFLDSVKNSVHKKNAGFSGVSRRLQVVLVVCALSLGFPHFLRARHRAHVDGLTHTHGHTHEAGGDRAGEVHDDFLVCLG